MQNALASLASVAATVVASAATFRGMCWCIEAYASTLEVSGRGGFLFVVATMFGIPMLLISGAVGLFVGAAVWERLKG
jgi:hypothetical protein